MNDDDRDVEETPHGPPDIVVWAVVVAVIVTLGVAAYNLINHLH